VVNELIPLDQLDARYTSGVVIRIDSHVHGTDILPRSGKSSAATRAVAIWNWCFPWKMAAGST